MVFDSPSPPQYFVLSYNTHESMDRRGLQPMTFIDTSAAPLQTENRNKALDINNSPFEGRVVCFFIPVLLDF